ncbi:hypothetical protein BOTBODRAFT_110948, partial [Botryobasidium botryosum FD-172 SS1]
MLVPIRIDIDFDHYRLRETFVWNLNDPVVTPELFAEITCEDLELPTQCVSQFVTQLKQQLADFQTHVTDKKRKYAEDGEDGHVKSEVVDIDITVGSMSLVDQFEWDVNDPNNSPEGFAEVYAADLGLSGEFKTAIAHDIREQVQLYHKSLFLVGHPFDGTPVLDDDLRMAFLAPVTSVTRTVDEAQAFTPLLNILTEAEMERIEKEREKELKRKKRQTRGR